jgi:hypothetical protein
MATFTNQLLRHFCKIVPFKRLWIPRNGGFQMFQSFSLEVAVILSASPSGHSISARTQIPVTHFCLRLSRSQGHSAAERIR